MPTPKEFRKTEADVRSLLIRHHDRLEKCGTISEVYQVLDFEYLKLQGLPWLDSDAFKVLWPHLHKLSVVERAARKIWESPNDPALKLADHLEAQRHRKEYDFAQAVMQG